MVETMVGPGCAGRVCAYCGEASLTGTERPEHPVPHALGSSLEIFSVCDPCNEWAGADVDQPFLGEDWVRAHRALHDVRDPRHPRRRPPNPILRGVTKDGVHVVTNSDGTPRFVGRIINEGKTTRILAGSEEEARRLLAREQRRAAERGEEVKILNEQKTAVLPEITATVALNFFLWGRMAAKIALGVGSYAYPEEWRLSSDASFLRAQMRDPRPTSPTGEPMGLIPGRLDADSPFRKIADGPSHVLWFNERQNGETGMSGLLFGELIFSAIVDTTGRPVPSVSWHLDPRQPNLDGKTTFNRLIDAAVRRAGPI